MVETPTLTLKSGYAKPRFEGTKTFRYATPDECANLRTGDRVLFLSNQNTVLEAKVNGTPKTWKTRPGDVEIPLKYGMYEYGRAYVHTWNCQRPVYSGDTILIEV